jgi:hypothetical protein
MTVSDNNVFIEDLRVIIEQYQVKIRRSLVDIAQARRAITEAGALLELLEQKPHSSSANLVIRRSPLIS